jgi:dCMP deaminase
MNNARPSWDEYFIQITRDTSLRSSCLKRKVGAVIVRENRILATGYNGAPRGIDSCFDSGVCWRRNQGIAHGTDKDLCMAAHAEANAFSQAAREGISLKGATLYVTTHPCITCAKEIIQTGIISVNYLEEYYGAHEEFSKYLLEKAGIPTRKL